MKARRIVVCTAVMVVSAAAWVVACGPFWTSLSAVLSLGPSDEATFAAGTLGVVRPHFHRLHLVQSYRVFSGLSALPAADTTPSPAYDSSAAPAWQALRDRILGGPPAAPYAEEQWRAIPDTYSEFWNCTDDAFTTARLTLEARIARFGQTSRQVKEWLDAQVAVFANCAGTALVLPAEPSASTDALIRSDRAYQIAAAYFYNTQFDEAANRFRRIANDPSSPWRPYGHFLAARATIRSATLTTKDTEGRNERLREAEPELRQVLGDPSAAHLHASARRLLDFTGRRVHPLERLHEVSARLASAAELNAGEAETYTWLMDRVPDRDALGDNDDLTDWVITMQGAESGAFERAAERWRDTQAPRWLIAALWHVPNTSAADPVLASAAALPRQSPAFATASFLRVRALVGRGQRTEAKRVLGTLPRRVAPGFDIEAINLLNGERLMLADSLAEFLSSAPRQAVNNDFRGRPIFDDDATITINARLPIGLLTEAAEAVTLPAKLLTRVAIVALTRALIVGDTASALRVAPVLRTIAPVLKGDLDRFVQASTPDDRRYAGLLLLLRTPGADTTVPFQDDDHTYALAEPNRLLRRAFFSTWWCGVPSATPTGSASETRSLLYSSGVVPYPSFVTPAQRTATEQEIRSITRVGTGREYLARETLAWATARPNDPNLAEALARVVDGWRNGCGTDTTGTLPRQAFRTLHRLFPNSEWARRTKYWYQ